jgi:cell division protein ZapE
MRIHVDPPLAAYEAGIRAGDWQDDPAQRRALLEFDRLHRALLQPAPSAPLLARLFRRKRTAPAAIRGLYLWGGVGRGKTFLMDLFHDGLRGVPKLRLHFHRFMGRVHSELKTLKDQADPLRIVAERLAQQARVLCFDEFFVADIGDAMLLGRLLQQLFARSVVLVATSNVEPKLLYQDGLQRARFLPAIAAIEEHCVVLELKSAQDYRLRALTQAQVYHHPLDARAEAALAAAFERLATTADDARATLRVNDREIPVRQRAGDVIWFDFDALCGGPRSAADYIEIARSFPTVLLSGVPVFDALRENEARRFIHLIDEFYDRGVKLVLSAAAAPTELYRGERLATEFSRTVSRLIEMQSAEYLGRAHHDRVAG